MVLVYQLSIALLQCLNWAVEYVLQLTTDVLCAIKEMITVVLNLSSQKLEGRGD